MTKTQFSKPSLDIKKEYKNFINKDSDMLAVQKKAAKLLNKLPARKICQKKKKKITKGASFIHRNSKYIICNQCGHIQSLSDSTMLNQKKISNSFSKIYKPENDKSYFSRRDRIYEPKLKWMISNLNSTTYNKKKLAKSKWLELGCGAGHFLSLLKKYGYNDYLGIDSNQDLIEVAQSKCGKEKAIKSENFIDLIKKSTADIYVSFFVLEHLDNPNLFWEMMKGKPKGTLFLFSVPSLSFSTLLESSFDNYSARSLDNHVHTQLYSDKSLDYIIRKSGYVKSAEWLFGQDAMDLYRLLLRNNNSMNLANSILHKTNNLLDEIQSIFDKSRICDARHILIEKK